MYRLVLGSKWNAGWNMMAQINFKPIYSICVSHNICVITHQGLYNRSFLPNCVKCGSVASITMIKPIITLHLPECRHNGSFSRVLGYVNDKRIRVTIERSMEVCQCWKGLEVPSLCDHEWVLQLLKWIDVLRGSLCFKGIVFWIGEWHDEIVDCHSCLAPPANRLWLNSHSFPKEKGSPLETYKPHGQVNKTSWKQPSQVLSFQFFRKWQEELDVFVLQRRALCKNTMGLAEFLYFSMSFQSEPNMLHVTSFLTE